MATCLLVQNPKQVLDLTEDKTNTLSPELTSSTENPAPEGHCHRFLFPEQHTATAEKLLSNIKSDSNGKFDYQFINPDRDPQAAINAGITGDGKILLQMGQQKEIVAGRQ